MEDEHPTKSGIPASSSPEDSVEVNEIVTELGDEARWKQEIIQSLLEPCDHITYGQRQREAAQKLGVSVRTVRRLVKKWEEQGLEALTQTNRTDKGKHRIEWQFKTTQGCARHGLRLLSECPNCKARFKIPALWVNGWCQRCFLPFKDIVIWQKATL